MFPLTSSELENDFDIEKILKFGSLPRIFSLDDENSICDYLFTYAETYLKEEIQQEALVRNLASYQRFLKHVALSNAQVMNLSNISREASVPRSTLDGYFSILQDTLIGSFLEPLHLKSKIKEVSNPKFYLFDCGIVRALANELGQELGAQKGFLLETFIYNELRATSVYQSRRWEFNYWGTPGNTEVDFIISQGREKFGIEVKSSTTWRRQYGNALRTLKDDKKIKKGIGIYLGQDKIIDEGIEVFPVNEFCSKLSAGLLF